MLIWDYVCVFVCVWSSPLLMGCIHLQLKLSHSLEFLIFLFFRGLVVFLVVLMFPLLGIFFPYLVDFGLSYSWTGGAEIWGQALPARRQLERWTCPLGC